MDSKIIFVGSRGEPSVGFLSGVVSGSGSAFSVEIFGSGETLTLQAVARRGQFFIQSEFAEKFEIVRSSTIASWSSPAAMSKYSTSSAGT